ncbi:CsiV family protein [Thalassotalea fonticola]|uniref:CsiV family protein n=1 Tax=Thalassotalea fonticola TaxID=3065649 RepID=A0ABZ0GSJ8_9GAMM|nr:CsiV family protein [Colwelliaceae bacterium S1-1]
MQINNAITTIKPVSIKQTKSKITKLTFLGAMLFSLLGVNAMAQTAIDISAEKPVERWFEIEVILIEQLIDKSPYNEDFNQQVAMGNSKSSNNIPLLNSYLQNIINFEQQLDDCNIATAVSNSSDDTTVKNSQPIEQTDNKTTLAEVEQDLINLSLACKHNNVNIFENAIEQEFYQIPKIISANEDLYAKVPYLLNKKSLQLAHIRKSLARSKHFRPLLHMGWRQAVLDRRSAKPVRLMAGENQSLTKVTSEKMITLTEDLQLSEEEKQQIISNHLHQIITDVEQNNTELATLTKQINGQKIQPLFDNQNLATTADKTEQRQQSWHIDGLFNVHLDHYLYINSQFNVITATKSNDDSGEVIVPFKQNRRVISGEIHYFDHPYMGMIVQIRRHEKPEVIDEDSQDTEEPDVTSDRSRL